MKPIGYDDQRDRTEVCVFLFTVHTLTIFPRADGYIRGVSHENQRGARERQDDHHEEKRSHQVFAEASVYRHASI